MREQLIVMGEEKVGMWGDFPGGPVAKTLSSHCMLQVRPGAAKLIN